MSNNQNTEIVSNKDAHQASAAGSVTGEKSQGSSRTNKGTSKSNKNKNKGRGPRKGNQKAQSAGNKPKPKDETETSGSKPKPDKEKGEESSVKPKPNRGSGNKPKQWEVNNQKRHDEVVDLLQKVLERDQALEMEEEESSEEDLMTMEEEQEAIKKVSDFTEGLQEQKTARSIYTVHWTKMFLHVVLMAIALILVFYLIDIGRQEKLYKSSLHYKVVARPAAMVWGSTPTVLAGLRWRSWLAYAGLACYMGCCIFLVGFPVNMQHRAPPNVEKELKDVCARYGADTELVTDLMLRCSLADKTIGTAKNALYEARKFVSEHRQHWTPERRLSECTKAVAIVMHFNIVERTLDRDWSLTANNRGLWFVSDWIRDGLLPSGGHMPTV
jgi:hypothetical protein